MQDALGELAGEIGARVGVNGKEANGAGTRFQAGAAGFEPATSRVTVGRSAN